MQEEKKSSHILHRSKQKCCELTDYRVELIYDPKNCVYYNSSNIFTDLSENFGEKKDGIKPSTEWQGPTSNFNYTFTEPIFERTLDHFALLIIVVSTK